MALRSYMYMQRILFFHRDARCACRKFFPTKVVARCDVMRPGGTDFSLGHFRSVLPTFYFSVSLVGEGGS